MLASQDHAYPALSPVRACWFALPSSPALRSIDSAADTVSGSALFAGFLATMTGLDFPRPCSIGYASSPSRCGPSFSRNLGRREAGSPSFRREPFARDVALDPGRASAPRIAVPHMLPSSELIITLSAPAISNLSWLNPTPHAIAVYASRPLSPVATQHSLPSRTLPFA